MAHFFEQIAHSLIFRQKTSDSLRNQISEFPALGFLVVVVLVVVFVVVVVLVLVFTA